MAGNHDMDTYMYETCAYIRMSQSVDLDNPVAAGKFSALPKVSSLLTSARALVRFSIDTKNCLFYLIISDTCS
jgi:hypothetical protein